MSEKIYNVLFLCTHNSARSVIAECIVNRLGQGKFRGYSAGSQPGGQVHPYAIQLLLNNNFPVSELRSKSWDEFATPGAPKMDFVFTVCDDAAGEVCPLWPGQPITAHWGVPDPSRAEGSEAEKMLAFVDAHRILSQRILVFLSLPFVNLDRLALKKRLDDIGKASAQVQALTESF
jgi:protein-tyrosine-phosphatase